MRSALQRHNLVTQLSVLNLTRNKSLVAMLEGLPRDIMIQSYALHVCYCLCGSAVQLWTELPSCDSQQTHPAYDPVCALSKQQWMLGSGQHHCNGGLLLWHHPSSSTPAARWLAHIISTPPIH